MLQPGGLFARIPPSERPRYEPVPNNPYAPKPDALTALAASANCRFRAGFAAEGMLCDDPPLPLRVLDFLEDTEDLLNLALVCKAMHQAGHALLKREVRSSTFAI